MCCRGAPRKYLDSLLASSRLELFRPGVDLLAAGDAVNELFVVVAGRVELRCAQASWHGLWVLCGCELKLAGVPLPLSLVCCHPMNHLGVVDR